jgi:hypothetical protein
VRPTRGALQHAAGNRPVHRSRPSRARIAACACLLLASTGIAHAGADEASGVAPQRPALKSNRWQEDWSVLADPALLREPLDGLKFIALPGADRQRYLSLGATLRERFESNDAPDFGTAGARSDAYLLQRLQLHADLHVADSLRFFAQLEDARAFGKQALSAADQNRLDLRLAFAEYELRSAAGTLKSRIGRQDFAFDLQRFVSSRDGPNVRQSFDAAWLDWETPAWRVIGFVSRPVQYRDDRAFDDHSNRDLRFDTLRVERHVLGENELSAYYSLYQKATARYGDAIGPERRDVLDVRFAGAADGLDWDVEAMRQGGSVGPATIRAWAAGSRGGYTFAASAWRPRVGLQIDAASGDGKPGDGRLGTFNPLFPNGYYFTLAGYTGYTNLIHLKPSLTIRPAASWTVLAAAGLLWRQTTADAVYVQPSLPVAGTAGHGGRWTGRYEQLRIDAALDAHTAVALEAVHYEVGAALRSVGGHDSSYLGVELKLMW